MSADRAADVKRDRVTVARDLCFQFSDIWYQFLSVSVLSLISVSFRRKRPKKMNPKKNTRESMIRTRKKKAAGSQRDWRVSVNSDLYPRHLYTRVQFTCDCLGPNPRCHRTGKLSSLGSLEPYTPSVQPVSVGGYLTVCVVSSSNFSLLFTLFFLLLSMLMAFGRVTETGH